MAGEFERCSSADLNRPLVDTDSEVLEKVSYIYNNNIINLIVGNFFNRINYFQHLWGCYDVRIGHS